jgi:hypothetical protein
MKESGPEVLKIEESESELLCTGCTALVPEQRPVATVDNLGITVLFSAFVKVFSLVYRVKTCSGGDPIGTRSSFQELRCRGVEVNIHLHPVPLKLPPRHYVHIGIQTLIHLILNTQLPFQKNPERNLKVPHTPKLQFLHSLPVRISNTNYCTRMHL